MNKEASNQKLSDIMELVLEAAKQRFDDARLSGRMDDGGAKHLETQVRFFQHGMAGRIPPEWEKFHIEVIRRNDPEWSTFQRLSKKFGGAG